MENVAITNQNSRQGKKKCAHGFAQNYNSNFGGSNTFGGQSFYGKGGNLQNNARGIEEEVMKAN